MTDFELMTLFYEIENSIQIAFMNYVTIIFAFLLAGFFAADKLNRPMTIVVIVLFTFAAFQQAGAYILTWSDQAGLLPDIASRDALQWHSAAKVARVAGLFFSITYITTAIIGYFGALIFFFHQRHQGLKSS